jgi:hypothetical protein
MYVCLYVWPSYSVSCQPALNRSFLFILFRMLVFFVDAAVLMYAFFFGWGARGTFTIVYENMDESPKLIRVGVPTVQLDQPATKVAMNGWMDGWMDGCMVDGWMNTCEMDGWMDGWMDGA